jgi:hypothetical protein
MKKYILSIALMLISTLSASAQGGRAIKFIKWPVAPAVVLIDVPWYQKVWNVLVKAGQWQYCNFVNGMNLLIPPDNPVCTHATNHFPNLKGAKWYPPKK